MQHFGAEDNTQVFTPHDFWNAIKHRSCGKVYVAANLVADGKEGDLRARLYLRALWHDIVPDCKGWYNVVSAWIRGVKQSARR